MTFDLAAARGALKYRYTLSHTENLKNQNHLTEMLILCLKSIISQSMLNPFDLSYLLFSGERKKHIE